MLRNLKNSLVTSSLLVSDGDEAPDLTSKDPSLNFDDVYVNRIQKFKNDIKTIRKLSAGNFQGLISGFVADAGKISSREIKTYITPRVIPSEESKLDSMVGFNILISLIKDLNIIFERIIPNKKIDLGSFAEPLKELNTQVRKTFKDLVLDLQHRSNSAFEKLKGVFQNAKGAPWGCKSQDWWDAILKEAG